jgi:hypothetical protein
MDSRTLARFSFPIPFWALSISFLRVARHSEMEPDRPLHHCWREAEFWPGTEP